LPPNHRDPNPASIIDTVGHARIAELMPSAGGTASTAVQAGLRPAKCGDSRTRKAPVCTSSASGRRRQPVGRDEWRWLASTRPSGDPFIEPTATEAATHALLGVATVVSASPPLWRTAMIARRSQRQDAQQDVARPAWRGCKVPGCDSARRKSRIAGGSADRQSGRGSNTSLQVSPLRSQVAMRHRGGS